MQAGERVAVGLVAQRFGLAARGLGSRPARSRPSCSWANSRIASRSSSARAQRVVGLLGRPASRRAAATVPGSWSGLRHAVAEALERALAGLERVLDAVERERGLDPHEHAMPSR